MMSSINVEIFIVGNSKSNLICNFFFKDEYTIAVSKKQQFKQNLLIFFEQVSNLLKTVW